MRRAGPLRFHPSSCERRTRGGGIAKPWNDAAAGLCWRRGLTRLLQGTKEISETKVHRQPNHHELPAHRGLCPTVVSKRKPLSTRCSATSVPCDPLRTEENINEDETHQDLFR